jgi:hypothetical protein
MQLRFQKNDFQLQIVQMIFISGMQLIHFGMERIGTQKVLVSLLCFVFDFIPQQNGIIPQQNDFIFHNLLLRDEIVAKNIIVFVRTQHTMC